MRSKSFGGRSDNSRGGYILLVMLLLIVLLGGLVWLDPSAFPGKGDKELPWNQVRRIVPDDEEVPQPREGQVRLATPMKLRAQCEEDGQDRGEVAVCLNAEGRVYGMWSADYYPRDEVRYEVVMGRFEGNVDPAYIYEDDSGEDPGRLYIITEGHFMILETREESGRVRKVSGRLYVTGWISPDYMFEGKVTITSDKRDYFEYEFEGQLEKGTLLVPDGPTGLPGLFGG